MKIGILVVFRNAEKEIHIEEFVKLFTKTNTNAFEICLVNNGSSDDTLQRLHQMKAYQNASVSVIDIKKKCDQDAAIKAGIRYLDSQKNVAFILCLEKFSKSDTKLLARVFSGVNQQKGMLISLFKKTKRIVHKNVFCMRSILREVSLRFKVNS